VTDEEDITAITIDHISNCVKKASSKIIHDLNGKGYAIVDNFLSNKELSTAMRKEAEGYYEGGDMILSQSTRFDPTNNDLITYNKHNVYSMQLMGGSLYYKGPRLHEYSGTLDVFNR
jgi:hypothetical protein